MFDSKTLRRTIAGCGLAVGITAAALTGAGMAVGAGAAYASSCGNLYGGDMPTDNGAAEAPCSTPPAQPPATTQTTTQAPAPKPTPTTTTAAPVVKTAPVVKSKAPAPTTVATRTVAKKKPKAQTPVVRTRTTPKVSVNVVPNIKARPTPTRAPKKIVPTPKTTTQAAHPEPQVHVVKQPAVCAATPVAYTYHFPWLLVLGFGLMMLLGGGLVGPRLLIAHGHKWPTAIRRFVGGIDHHLIPAPTPVTEDDTETPTEEA